MFDFVVFAWHMIDSGALQGVGNIKPEAKVCSIYGITPCTAYKLMTLTASTVQESTVSFKTPAAKLLAGDRPSGRVSDLSRPHPAHVRELVTTLCSVGSILIIFPYPCRTRDKLQECPSPWKGMRWSTCQRLI